LTADAGDDSFRPMLRNQNLSDRRRRRCDQAAALRAARRSASAGVAAASL